MSAAHTPSTLPDEAKDIHVSPSDIAVGVVIGRSSEFFDFFVFAIASVIVFPARYFSFADPLTATLWSFTVFALAFLARPAPRQKRQADAGAADPGHLDRRHGPDPVL